MPSEKLSAKTIEALAKDPIIIGIFVSSLIGIISLILVVISIFKKPETPQPDNNVETNNEVNSTDPGTIGDRVWMDSNRDGIQDEGETGIGGLSVYLIDTNTKQVKNNTLTNETGNYLFSEVPVGNYEVEVVIATNLIASPLQLAENKEADNDFNSLDQSEYGLGRVVKSIPIPILGGEENLGMDAGIHTYEEISGYAWIDLNENGTREETDRGVQGIVVSLLDEENSVVDSRITSETGLYQFNSIEPGRYSVKFDSNPNYTTQDPSEGVANLEQLTTAPKYTDLVEVIQEQKVANIDSMIYELTPEIKEALQTANVETSSEATVTPGDTAATPIPTTTAIIQDTGTTPTPTSTLTAIPTETPTQTITLETGSGSEAVVTTEVTTSSEGGTGGSSLVTTGLPIFILGILGGINLIMLKFTNNNPDAKVKRRKIKRYVNL